MVWGIMFGFWVMAISMHRGSLGASLYHPCRVFRSQTSRLVRLIPSLLTPSFSSWSHLKKPISSLRTLKLLIFEHDETRHNRKHLEPLTPSILSRFFQLRENTYIFIVVLTRFRYRLYDFGLFLFSFNYPVLINSLNEYLCAVLK